MDPREVQGMGPGRAHRNLRRALPDAERARCSNWSSPTRFTAKLQEPPVAGDPTSGQQDEQLPSYNAYSIDGDVTAPLVYVNYGVPDDYEQLDRLGVSVKGAIVIARYGGSWRGIKPKVAAGARRHRLPHLFRPARRRLLQATTFSRKARMRPRRRRAARQRDGHARLSRAIRSRPASARPPTPSAWRSKMHRALTKIPVLPISYGDAQPLLAALTGPVAPRGWRGALPITYHVGPGPGEGASQGRVQLGHQAALRRDRAHSRRRLSRTNGSSAATITTPG